MHLASLAAQTIQPERYCFIDDCNEASAESDCLVNFAGARNGIIISSDYRRSDFPRACEPYGHNWTLDSIYAMAHMRSDIMAYARQHNVRWLFMADTDLILDPTVLEKLFETPDAPVRVARFKTSRKPGVPTDGVFQNVWQSGDQDCHTFDEWLEARRTRRGDAHLHQCKTDFKDRLDHQTFVPVGGGGACTLFDLRNIPPKCDYRPVSFWFRYLDRIGEDRFFCLRCDIFGVRILCRTDCRIYHCFREAHVPYAREMCEQWGVPLPNEETRRVEVA